MYKSIFLFIFANVFALTLEGQFRTKKIISSHAILQHDVELPISGWANPGEKVSLSIAGSAYSSTSDETGKWTIIIPPQNAGGPYQINIEAGSDLLQYEDIYFGDVWLCSGQSNMAWPLRNTLDAEKEIANADDPLLRQFKVDRLNEDQPVEDFPEGSWIPANEESLGDFTAVGYYFAKELRKTQKVPIGLLNSSWGGSRIEPWISKETLDEKHPEYSYDRYTRKHKIDLKKTEKGLKNMFPDLNSVDAGLLDGKPIWTGPIEEGKWKNIDPEKLWEDQGYQKIDGVAWYRTEFEAKDALSINLGMIDDNDMAWVNGVMIGSTNGYNIARSYEVPASALQNGKNELLIRIEDTGGGGGMYMSDAQTDIGGRALSTFDWKIRFGAVSINTLNNQIPNIIYNAMIHPVIDFPIKGVIWYQGESNTGSLREAFDYRYVLRTLIQEWRNKWGQPELPFLYVSLANFRAAKEEPSNDGWAVIRESMTDVLNVPNTGQAIIIDIGNADDIHPRNKEDVGKRLALPARHIVYGEDVVSGSPMYGNHEVMGNHIAINFKNIGKGLMVKNKYAYVNGFTIAGADGKFAWAKAKLENDKVIVWHESISNPVAVRYAWETNPEDANLFTKDGLPLTPFRTDDWDITKE